MQLRRPDGLQDAAKRRSLVWMFGMASGAMMLTQVGCIPFIANMIYAVKGNEIPAEYTGLKKQRVAILTISDSSHYSDDVAARYLNRLVSETLLLKVKDLSLVREDEVDQWRDTQGFSDIDYVSLGRGVKAEKVLAIEMTNLRLRDGQTLYRGTANITIAIYNVADGTLEFRRTLDDYAYPVTAGIPVTEISEDRFRRLFLEELSRRLARFFHPYDFRDSVARDAKIVSY